MRFVNLWLNPIAVHIPPGVNPEAYQWFQTVDSDHSGFINLKELKQALVNSNWSAFNDETCLMMISEWRWPRTCSSSNINICYGHMNALEERRAVKFARTELQMFVLFCTFPATKVPLP